MHLCVRLACRFNREFNGNFFFFSQRFEISGIRLPERTRRKRPYIGLLRKSLALKWKEINVQRIMFEISIEKVSLEGIRVNDKIEKKFSLYSHGQLQV